MKKLSVFAACFAVMLFLSTVSFAQPGVILDVNSPPTVVPELTVEAIVTDAPSPIQHTAACPCQQHTTAGQVLPFGYPPYPTAGGYPAYGIPYSYPRAARRAARLAQPPVQPYPLPAPGSVPAAPFAYAPAHPIQTPLQGTIGIGDFPPVPACPPGQPTVFYRPTPIKNFLAMLTAPRPYIGYDPYAGYPPYPGYIPPQ